MVYKPNMSMTETDQNKPDPGKLLRQAHHRITARIRKLQTELEDIGESDHAPEKSFHSARVLTRKIQAGLTAFKPLIRKKTRKKIQNRVKDIRRSASEVRDVDVCLELLKTFPASLKELRQATSQDKCPAHRNSCHNRKDKCWNILPLT